MSDLQAHERVGEPGSYRLYVLFILMLTYLFSFMDRQILSILIEDIGAGFAARGHPLTDTHKGLLMGLAFAMFYTVLGVPIARLADRYSRKNIIAGAITFWSVATALCAAATGFWSLFAARVAVGIGEAGGTAPAHSLITDYFKKSELSRAIAVYSMGAVLGLTVALMAGSYIADLTSWRNTLLIVAAPGVLLGTIMLLTVKEPRRGRFVNNYTEPDSTQPFVFTFRDLVTNKPYVGSVLSHTAAVLMGYVIVTWGFTLFLRNFGMSKTEVGMLFGPAVFLGGVPGMLAGGFLADILAKRDARWMGWIPAIGSFLSIPAFMVALFIGAAVPMAIFFGLGIFCFNVAHAPSLGIIQAVVKPNQRATAASFVLFLSNLIGLGAGPIIVGWISTQLKPNYGALSLNYAFAIMLISMLVASLGFLWTARQLKGYLVEDGGHGH